MYRQNCLNCLLFTKQKCPCFQIDTNASTLKLKRFLNKLTIGCCKSQVEEDWENSNNVTFHKIIIYVP